MPPHPTPPRKAAWPGPRARARSGQRSLALLSPPTPKSKGGILSKACDYIRELRQTNQRMQETFKEAERLQMDNELLRQQVRGGAGLGGASPGAGSQPLAPRPVCHVCQIEELKNENAVLRAQLQQHNLEMVGESARQ